MCDLWLVKGGDIGKSKSQAETMDVDMSIDTSYDDAGPSSSGVSAQSRMFVDKATQTTEKNTILKLRKKIRTLKQKVRRRNLKISTMKDVIKEISKRGYNTENLDTVLKNYFEGIVLYYGLIVYFI